MADARSLFQWFFRDDASAIHRALDSRGILTRLFDAPASLRFGLPPDEAGIARLDAALARLSGVNRCEP